MRTGGSRSQTLLYEVRAVSSHTAPTTLRVVTLHLRPTCAALLLLALVACEDEQDIGVALSGDLDGVACGTQFSGDAGIDVSFFTVTEQTIHVDLGIDLVTRGTVGSAAGSVTLAPFEFATTVTWTTN